MKGLMKGHPESGITLMETLMAMFLMAAGLVGLALTFPEAGVAVHQGYELTRAAALAERRMETARRTPYASLPSLSSLDASDNATLAPYTITTTVTPNDPAANLTRVNVAVQGGTETNVVVESFFSAP